MDIFRTTSLFDFLYVKNQIPAGWESFFNSADIKEEMKNISDDIKNSLSSEDVQINPLLENVFKAFELTPLEKVKVIIIGQDPAPELGLAQGLAFSIPSDISTSKVPSIQRVLLEAQNEKINVDSLNGNLTRWAEQGVLLLNETLTISCSKEKKNCTPDSHRKIWEKFTPLLLSYINNHISTGVYIFWGADVQKNERKIDTNKFLENQRVPAIDWSLTDKENKTKEAYIWSWSPSKKISLLKSTALKMNYCSVADSINMK